MSPQVLHPVPVELRIVEDPEGYPAVLLQFEHGWLVLPPNAARSLAHLVLEMADAIEESG